MRIIIADDHSLFRAGLKQLLELENDMDVIGDVRTGVEAVNIVVAAKPDMLVVDFTLPDIEGDEVCRRVKQKLPSCKIVVVTAHGEHGILRRLVDSGADGYVLKAADYSEMLSAMRMVAMGGHYIDPRLGGEIMELVGEKQREEEILSRLTPREKEIIACLSKGMSNQEIADALYLSERTVKNYVSVILHKLDVRDRTQAALLISRMKISETTKK